MSLKLQTQEIDGLTARTVQLPALSAYDLLTKLGEIVLPVVTLAGALEGEFEEDLDKLGPLLQGLFKHIKGDAGKQLILEILAQTSVVITEDGKPANVELTSQAKINEAFSGRLMTMFKVCAFAIQVNYRDFIDAAKARAAQVAAKRQAAKLLAAELKAAPSNDSQPD